MKGLPWGRKQVSELIAPTKRGTAETRFLAMLSVVNLGRRTSESGSATREFASNSSFRSAVSWPA